MASEKDIESMERLVSLFNGARIKHTYGMNIRYDDRARAIFELPYHAGFDHALGGIHGGVIATLLDNAGWFTAAVPYDTWIATVEFEVRLLEPVKAVDLWSRGELVRAGKRLAMAQMSVYMGESTLVASGAGTFAVTSQPLS